MTNKKNKSEVREFWIYELPRNNNGPAIRVIRSLDENHFNQDWLKFRVIEFSAYQQLEKELAAANKKLERLRKAHSHNHFTRDIKERGECPACDRYHEKYELKAANEKLEIATKTINQMQGKIRPWMNPNNTFGQDLTEAFNIGAKFNAENSDLFNSYLKLEEKK